MLYDALLWKCIVQQAQDIRRRIARGQTWSLLRNRKIPRFGALFTTSLFPTGKASYTLRACGRTWFGEHDG